ncbi:TetR family transcriptional regulator [Erwinia sp. P6884]|uniref:TetR/AcrR family transcriptional regulator n=1 Tax=Erwinia sp. P6884 TaxID=3141450 RepID=UPI003188EA0D
MAGEAEENVKRTRRYDPARKEKILDKAFETVAEFGVAGVTHRRIAALAGVPLGSMTYHFKSMDELLFMVFSRFAQDGADFIKTRMEKAETPEDAIEIFASIMTDREWVNSQNMAVLYEFYSLATREPACRQILTDWSSSTRQCLERFFSPAAARAFDVCIEGVLLQNFLNPDGGLPQDEIIALLRRISLTDIPANAQASQQHP